MALKSLSVGARRARILLAVAFVALVAAAGFAVLGSHQAGNRIAALAALLAAAVTLLTALRNRSARTRRAWGVLGLGMLSYAVGLLALDLAAQPSLSLLDPANLLRLALYPALLAAIVLLMRRSRSDERPLSITLDAAILSLAVGAVVVEGVFNGLAPIGAVGGSQSGLLAFPLLDLAMLMCLALIAAPTRGRVGGAYLALGAGLLFLAAADISFAVSPDRQLGDTGSVAGLAWPAGLVAIGLATTLGVSLRNARALRGAWLYTLGVGSVAVCLAVLLSDALGDRDPLVIGLSLAGLCLAILRFMTLALENDRLARDTDGIINAAGEGIYRIDLDGRITYINPSALAILGFSEEEVLGRSAHQLFHHTRVNGASYPARECPVCRTLKKGVTQRVTGEQYWRADGSGFPADYTSAPLRQRGSTVGAVVVFDDVTRERQLEQRLRNQATHDSLTGLPNRLKLEEELSSQLRRAERYPHAGALLVINLDGFKLFNDSAGHRAGDEALSAVASMLSEEIAQTDVAARIGGDEFALLLREAREGEALALGRRLTAAIRSRITPQLGASVGLAPFDRARGRSADELLVWADTALEEAKQAGGGVVAVADSRAAQQVASVERIRAALASQRLAIYAQPIVEARSGRLAREELLVRMLDDAGRTIPPDSFLPTAERYGLIAEIDLFVLDEAVEMARRGRRVTVNLSGRSLGDPRILERIEAAIATGIDPGCLSFEITETAAVANMADARRFAADLHELGCGLALDDFGTGFSSFAYLKNIPVQVLKIDMDFIGGLARNPTDRHLVQAMVGIANGLGLSTVAEGVEDAETLKMVEALGIDCAQGFYIGVPQPFDWLEAPRTDKVAVAQNS
jgi:diguanylate cyclase (GGDEF)-like protein/PAS domain S-box-containing protein